MDTDDAQLQMRGLLMGFVVSRALQVAAELGVADALASGPKGRDALAREVRADPATLNRLLRACASFGVFEELADGRYANTPRSEFLRGAVPGSMRDLARMYGEAAPWQAWSGLEHSVRSGQPSFRHIHGIPFFEFLAQHPDSARRFDEAMVTSSRLLNDAVVEAYDWAQFGTLVDIAGGMGSTLAAIVRANPKLNGVLFDLAHVVERAREHLREQGVADRVRTQSGSFFETVPAGAEAYFMKHILHDWSDADCLRILGSCAKVMSERTKLLVCEKLVPPGNGFNVAKLMDLVMLVQT
ncbi:MAG TPA: methyltransferase, partial [Casimicrobiaceae bacterium]|nr:methyltransferase [Casimicrobiaceae bacterium]